MADPESEDPELADLTSASVFFESDVDVVVVCVDVDCVVLDVLVVEVVALAPPDITEVTEVTEVGLVADVVVDVVAMPTGSVLVVVDVSVVDTVDVDVSVFNRFFLA